MRSKVLQLVYSSTAQPPNPEEVRRPIDVAVLRDDLRLKQEFGPEEAVFAECLGMPVMVLAHMYQGRQGLCLLVAEPRLECEGAREGAWLPVRLFEPSPYQNVLWGLIKVPPAAEVAKRFIRLYRHAILERVLRTDRRVAVLARARQGDLTPAAEKLLLDQATWLKQHDAETNYCQARQPDGSRCGAELTRQHFIKYGAWVQACVAHLFFDPTYGTLPPKEEQ